MPLKAASEPKKFPLRRVISSTILIVMIIAAVMAMKKPKPVSAPLTTAVREASAQSFEAKVSKLEQAQAEGQAGAEVHLTAEEIRAAFTQSLTATPDTPAQAAATTTPQTATTNTPDPVATPAIQEPLVSFEGDVMKGQFVTELSGKKVYVTVNGHLGSKDGYATFEPTEFKVGDLSIPVSLVNDALQKKLLEQHDKLKLPDYISELKVENGELVIKQK
jgi:hypothetical protein